MAVDERRRVELFHRLSDALGEEAATTLSDLLPPRGDELATRADVRRLETRMDTLADRVTASEDGVRRSMGELDQRIMTSLEALEHRLGARIDQRISAAVTTQTRTLVLSQLAALVTIAALAFGLR